LEFNGCSTAQKLKKMESTEKTVITVQAIINAPIEKVWKCWTTPDDIIKWNNASDDWNTTKAENFIRTGGNFNYRMEALDRSMGFNFYGIYDQVITEKLIDVTIGDERKMKIVFTSLGNKTEVVETFEAEEENSIELQRFGWQSILDNFKKYSESNKD
jgi:uncharacterized protein YndB with AHSA1/START domain